MCIKEPSEHDRHYYRTFQYNSNNYHLTIPYTATIECSVTSSSSIVDRKFAAQSTESRFQSNQYYPESKKSLRVTIIARTESEKVIGLIEKGKIT